MEVEIGRIKACGQNGAAYTIVEYEKVTTLRPISGASQQVKGSKYLRLTDGRHVNFVDDETFKIVATNEIIRKI